MEPIEISVFGRPLGGKTTLMEKVRDLCCANGQKVEIRSERDTKEIITYELATVLASSPVRFTWNPGAVIYREEATGRLLDRARMAICLFDYCYKDRLDYYDGILFKMAKSAHVVRPIPWIYVLNMMDLLTVEIPELSLPVAEGELSKVSAWIGTGVKEFLERVTNEVGRVSRGE